MRKTIFVCALLLLPAACDKTKHGSTGTDSASSAHTPDALPYPLTTAELGEVGNFIGGILPDLTEMDGAFDFTDTTVSFSGNVPCPAGGAVAVAVQGQSDATVGVGTVQANVSANGMLVFSLCRLTLPSGRVLTLSGSVQLNPYSASINGSASLYGTGSFNGSDQIQLSGNLHVTVGDFDQNCSISALRTSTGSGSISSYSPVSANFSAQVQGQLCNLAVNAHYGFSLTP